MIVKKVLNIIQDLNSCPSTLQSIKNYIKSDFIRLIFLSINIKQCFLIA